MSRLKSFSKRANYIAMYLPDQTISSSGWRRLVLGSRSVVWMIVAVMLTFSSI